MSRKDSTDHSDSSETEKPSVSAGFSATIEIPRKQPDEERHPFILNVFMIFLYPFICRCSPITDDDIPATVRKDRTYNAIKKLGPRWRTMFAEYTLDLEEQQKSGKRYVTADRKADIVDKPSLVKACAAELLLFEDYLSWFYILVSVALRIIQSWASKKVVDRVAEKIAFSMGAPIPKPVFPYGWGVVLMLCPIVVNIFDSLGFRFIYHFSARLRAGLAALIYDKTLQLNINAQSMIDTGRLLTLISADSRQVGEEFYNVPLVISVPIYTVVAFIVLVVHFGWPIVTSLAIIILLCVMQFCLISFQFNQYKRYLRLNDKRNKIVNETIQGIRVVKYTGLEDVFVKKINVPRKLQNDASSWAQFWTQFGTSFMRVIIPVVNLWTIWTITQDRNYVQEQIAVEVLPYVGFVVLSSQYASILPPYIQNLSMMIASFRRIHAFLCLPELVIEDREEPAERDIDLLVEDVTCKWGDPPEIPLTQTEQQELKIKLERMKKEEARKRREKQQKQQGQEMALVEGAPGSSSSSSAPETIKEKEDAELRNISFSLKKGTLTMIIGGIGSGKSSIGGMIIGDMERVSGAILSRGTIAYCPQTAWINNDTVRGNITFGSPFNEAKYLEAIRVCGLETDIRLLAAGDQTVIGEKGVNLSGGQKARIQLARAVYSNRDVYVLDDPLSAVDAHVGRFIFENCICQELAGKTRLLMTNHPQFLARADNVLVLENGTIKAQGTYAQLREQGINFDEYIIHAQPKKEENAEGNTEQPNEEEKKLPSNTTTPFTLEDLQGQHNENALRLMTEEEQNTGMVPIGVYLDYFKTLNSCFSFAPWLLFVLMPEATQAFSDYWLGVLGNRQYEPDITLNWKFGLYGIFILVIVIFTVLRSSLMKFNVDRSNSILHEDLLQSVIHCPPSFFDTTPMGRILNRFTGDIPQTDLVLHNLIIQTYAHTLSLIGTVVIVAVDNPFFLYIGIPLLAVFAIFLGIYARAARNLQRLESISRSPVISHYSQTVTGAGLSTIRAYHIEDQWARRFNYLNDDWTTRFILFREAQKWSNLICGVLTSAFLIPVTIIGWNEMEPSKLIVAINSSSNFSVFATLVVTVAVELDSRMTSFERIRFYTNKLPQETRVVEVNPPKDWPSEGGVQYEHVTMKYRPGLPYVLKDVTFSLNPHEKVGVCGRTGAGKSSLLFTLFRLVELDPKLEPDLIDVSTGFPIKNDDPEHNQGRILIDGVDISKVPLSRLRRSIAIIPQDPTLFTGTLRKNLDLAGRCTDDEIWEVLDLVEMKDAVMALPFALDTQLSEGGNNFSCGQRQLICFARAILNHCKVVVLDEATASVDVETDAKIQETIRRVFTEQTVIVIAHRLNTIMNSDRIMVMDDGHVVELDTPANLCANPNSAFNALIRSTSS